MKQFAILSFLFLLTCNFLQAQVSWTATSNAKSITLGETFTYTISLENADGKRVEAPAFNNFEQLGPPSRSVSQTIVNGASSRSTSWTFTLQPKKLGNLKIGPATCLVDGKKLETNSITIKVVKGKKQNPTTATDLAKGIILKTEIEDETAYVGQPLRLRLKMYWKSNILNMRLKTEPDFSNFYVEDNRHGANRVVKEVINGETYTTKTIFQSIIYPKTTGKIIIGSYRLLVDVENANAPRRRSIFGTSPSYDRVEMVSDPISLDVADLPSPKPTNFTGSIGQLELSCSVDKRVLSTDDAVSLKVTLTGRGDTKQMVAPVFLSTDSLEIYPPKLLEETQTETPDGFIKQKSFEYLLLPKYAGTYDVQPKYIYFNSSSDTYEEITCNTIDLRVSQGSNKPRSTAAVIPDFDDGLAEISVDTGAKLSEQKDLSTPLSLLLGGLPIAALIGMLGFRFYQNTRPDVDYAALKISKARAVALAKLEQAKSAMDIQDARSFYDELSKAMYGYLEDKLGLPLSQRSESFVELKLKDLKIEPELIQRFKSILGKSQMALFAGQNDPADLRIQYEEAGNLIEAIEDQING